MEPEVLAVAVAVVHRKRRKIFGGDPADYGVGVLLLHQDPVHPQDEVGAVLGGDSVEAAEDVDDMDYIFDQIVEENNPVILDLKFLEKQSEKDFRQAGEILKLLRHQYGAEAILLSQAEDKNLIIVTPSRVKLVRKD